MASESGPEPDPSSEAPFHFQDKRRIDPETGELRTPSPANTSSETGGSAAADAAPGEEGIDHLDFEPSSVDVAASSALAASEAKAAELLDSLQRERASFTNYRNRALRDQEAARTRGAEDVLIALLPVLDDIDRARAHGELEGPFVAIADKLDAALVKSGVERYGAVGEVFDPTVHEALMHQPDPDAAEVTVQHVIDAGYRIGDKIVRAARVAVIGPQD